MGKSPAFQFYVKDWLSDVELQSASASTRGVWINALCRMWDSRTRGEIKGNEEILARLLNCQNGDFDQFRTEAQTLAFCYVSQEANGIITIRNRRMYNEEKQKEKNRLRQKRHYDKQKSNKGSNEKLTSPSPSPTPTTKKYSAKFEEWWRAYPLKKSKAKAYKIWQSFEKKKILPETSELITALNNQVQEKTYLQSLNKFCPPWKHPTTWLNQQCWEDEVIIPPTETPPPEFEVSYND